jgi:hypothetical protein
LISRDAASGGVGELNADVGRWAERVNRSLKDAYRQVNYILDVLNSGNVVKDADESVTSSITLQNDDDLFLPIKANLRYRFEMYLYVNSTGAGGFRQNWTLPSGAVGHCQIIYNSSTTPTSARRSALTGADFTIAAGAATEYVIHYIGAIEGGTVDGIAQMQWAQETSNGSATTVAENSWLEMSELRLAQV